MDSQSSPVPGLPALPNLWLADSGIEPRSLDIEPGSIPQIPVSSPDASISSPDRFGRLRYRAQISRYRAQIAAADSGIEPSLAAVANSLDFEHKYRSLVITWAPDARPADAQIGAVLDEFEKTAWASLEPDRYAWTPKPQAGGGGSSGSTGK